MNFSPGGGGAPFDRDRPPREHLAERQRRHAAGGGHAGQPREPRPQLAVGLEHGRRRRCTSGRVIVSSSVSTSDGIEAGRHLLQAREAANQQAGADRAASPTAPARRRRAARRRLLAAAPDRAAPADPRPASFRLSCTSSAAQAQRRRQPEQHARHERDAEREQQHAAVDRDLVQPRHAPRAERPESTRGSRREAAARARRRRARAARFRSAAGATMRARLAPSAARTAISCWRAERARQQQVRDVRAGDQQHEADRARSASTSDRRTSPTTCSCSGTMPNVSPPFGG